jgi:hypothetical protein
MVAGDPWSPGFLLPGAWAMAEAFVAAPIFREDAMAETI